MKTLQLTFTLILFFISCGDKVQQELTEQTSKETIKEESIIKEDGKYTNYFESGKIKEEGFITNGKKDGKYTSYFENGQIQHEMNFKDGNIIGKWTSYFENGNVNNKGNYLNEK